MNTPDISKLKRTFYFLTAGLLAILLAVSPALTAIQASAPGGGNAVALTDDASPDIDETEEDVCWDELKEVFSEYSRELMKVIPTFETHGLLSLLGIASEREEVVMKEVRQDLTAALRNLTDCKASLLEDEELALAVDEIIEDLLEEERFTERAQSQKEFLADIIRDERIIDLLGEVIGDFLADEQTVEDMEVFLDIMLDLLTDKDMYDYLQDSIAQFLEDERTSEFIDDIIGAIAEMLRASISGSIVDLTEDERLNQVIADMARIALEPVPDIAADMVEDERFKEITEEMTLLLLDYGQDSITDLLEDDEFQNMMSDMIIEIVDTTFAGLAGTLEDERLAPVIRHQFYSECPACDGEGEIDEEECEVCEGTGEGRMHGIFGEDQLLSQTLRELVDDLFQHEELQSFGEVSFHYLIEESMHRAEEYADEYTDDTLYISGFDLDLNIIPEAAWGIAEVPGDIVYLALFDWLAYGDEEKDLKSIGAWVEAFAELITPELVEAAGDVAADAVTQAIPEILECEDKREELANALEELFDDELTFDEAAQDIEEAMEGMPERLTETITAHIPYEDMASTIRDSEHVIEAFYEVVVERNPLEEIGTYIEEDTRLSRAVRDSLPSAPTDELATMIREDDRIYEIMVELLDDFPVENITRFLQEEGRAEMIGDILARMLLNLAADMVEEEELTHFSHEVLMNFLDDFDEEFGDTPGTLLMDSLARFFKHEDLPPFLADAILGYKIEMRPVAGDVFKQVVPNMFTRIITGG